MKVHLKLSSALRNYANGDPSNLSMELPSGTTVGGFIQKLGIPSSMSLVFWVNGRHAEYGTLLHHGDTVVISPVMAGG